MARQLKEEGYEFELRTCLESNRPKRRESRACRPESENSGYKRLTPRRRAPARLLGKRRFRSEFSDSASALDSKQVLTDDESEYILRVKGFEGIIHITKVNDPAHVDLKGVIYTRITQPEKE